MRKLRHEDLVAFALGDTEADCTPADIESDAEAGAELNEIERHLALHEALPELQPEPRLWRGLQEKIAAEPPRRSSRGLGWEGRCRPAGEIIT